MSSRGPIVLAASLALACAGDGVSLTDGITTDAEFRVRVGAAVPPGTPGDSGVATMRRNGFTCTAGRDSLAHLWCDRNTDVGP